VTREETYEKCLGELQVETAVLDLKYYEGVIVPPEQVKKLKEDWVKKRLGKLK